jgi:glycosyltransferase involved in cell wall biosynthesis
MRDSEPLLSVIIPVDGTEIYLKKCLDSVVYQTYKNIEIIVIDDWSPGNVEQLILPYVSQFNVKYFKPERKRYIGGARNLGLVHASGDYITYCDSDDWLDLTMYEDMIKAGLDTASDIITCSLYREYADRQEGVFKCFYDRQQILDDFLAFRIFTLQYEFGITLVGQVTNKLYRRDFLEKYQLRFLDDTYYEDLDYNFRAFFLSRRTVCVPNVKYHHLKRENSFVQSVSEKHVRDFFTVFSEIKGFLISQNSYDDYLFNFYAFAERFYNLVIRQIFEFELNDQKRKEMLRFSFGFLPSVFNLDEFIQYSGAEKIRKHLQPFISDTLIK